MVGWLIGVDETEMEKVVVASTVAGAEASY